MVNEADGASSTACTAQTATQKMWSLEVLALIAATFGVAECSGTPVRRRQARHRELIINGETAVEGRYPYFSTLNHYCGGALIAPDMILTAGHCKPKRSQYDKVGLHVGTYSFPIVDDDGDDKETDDNSSSASFFGIRRTIRHPDFVRGDQLDRDDRAVCNARSLPDLQAGSPFDRDRRRPRGGGSARPQALAGQWHSHAGGVKRWT